jgi:hypothetical protein
VDRPIKSVILYIMEKNTRINKSRQLKSIPKAARVATIKLASKGKSYGNGFDPKEIGIDDYRYSYDHSEGDCGYGSTGGNPADGD